MKLLSGFKSTLVEKLEYCDFTDHIIKKFSCATIVKKSGLFQTEINKTYKRKIFHMHQLSYSSVNQNN